MTTARADPRTHASPGRTLRVDPANMLVRAVISTAAPDRAGDVIVPAGLTSDKLPVTISFLGPAYSEPRLLAYAYAYEQAFPHRALPVTTPALPGEKFDY